MIQMQRVSKKHPCPICQKDNWCLLGKSLVICMRSQSPKEKVFVDGSRGWIHSREGGPFIPERRKPEVQRPTVNMAKVWSSWYSRTSPDGRARMAHSMGLTEKSMEMIGAAERDPKTWAFPMRDPANFIVGIRLRANNGSKFAVEGSHQGMFIPQCEPQPTVLLPEGPTNTAAVLSLGRYAIGRPSSNGAILSVAEAVKRLGCKRAVIVADTDPDRIWDKTGKHFNPGADGAELLASKLTIPNCTLLLPCKDMRDFVKGGGTEATLDYLVNQCVWRNP